MLKNHIDSVVGAGADVTIAAHSLGNMVVSHAITEHGLAHDRYFMINGAVPIEAYELNNENSSMWESSWVGLDRKVLAANWYELFASDPNDTRGDFRWDGRFQSVNGKLYNFFSPGEDVVENSPISNASLVQAFSDFSATRGAWKTQELIKGTSWLTGILFFDRKQAGWGINSNPYSSFPNTSSIPNSDLIVQPYFDPFEEPDLTSVDTTVASLKASESEVLYDVLARGIPAVSYATAANSLDSILLTRNFDMEVDGRNGSDWPTAGHTSSLAQNRWLHSDLKTVALPYVYKLYELFVSKGSLE